MQGCRQGGAKGALAPPDFDLIHKKIVSTIQQFIYMYACVVQVFIHVKIEGDDVHTTPSYIKQTPDSPSVYSYEGSIPIAK